MTCRPRCFPDPTFSTISGDDLREWQADRLAEARGILADAPHHPDDRVILGARVIAGLTGDPDERAEAQGLLEMMSSLAPNGGAA